MKPSFHLLVVIRRTNSQWTIFILSFESSNVKKSLLVYLTFEKKTLSSTGFLYNVFLLNQLVELVWNYTSHNLKSQNLTFQFLKENVKTGHRLFFVRFGFALRVSYSSYIYILDYITYHHNQLSLTVVYKL